MAHIHHTTAAPIGTQGRHLPAIEESPSDDGDCCVTIDRHGIVTSCSEASGLMFGGGTGSLIGQRIWAMITNMAPSYASPSFNARYLAAMSTDGRWRCFQAVDMHGRHFPVEVSFAIADDDGHGSLLVSLRRPTGPAAKERFKAV